LKWPFEVVDLDDAQVFFFDDNAVCEDVM